MDRKQVNRRPFSISIYQGPSLEELRPLEGSLTPAVTKSMVQDFPAGFVADPFLAREGERWYLFFETKAADSRHGKIACAKSSDLRHWDYLGLVSGLVESGEHISYPHVFHWGSHWWMTPETEKGSTISLFRAVEFPRRWERYSVLVQGGYCDPTPFEHDGHWYLLGSDRYTLRLWHAESPVSRWQEHPASPLRVRDLRAARPAGRVIRGAESSFRLAQDCGEVYGFQVFRFEITRLTPTHYEERPLGRIIGAGEEGAWNEYGMHHLDAHRWGDGWIAAVDGR